MLVLLTFTVCLDNTSNLYIGTKTNDKQCSKCALHGAILFFSSVFTSVYAVNQPHWWRMPYSSVVLLSNIRFRLKKNPPNIWSTLILYCTINSNQSLKCMVLLKPRVNSAALKARTDTVYSDRYVDDNFIYM